MCIVSGVKRKTKRLTQLVFCDLSTPKPDGFNVYDDLRNLLITMGIPENEVQFIHSANTEVKKAELFAKVRSGDVRVLMGSTGKMGAGTMCSGCWWPRIIWTAGGSPLTLSSATGV